MFGWWGGQGLADFKSSIAAAGYQHADILTYAAGGGQIAAGLLLVLGLFTPLAAAGALAYFINGVLTGVASHNQGWFDLFLPDGHEYHVMLIVVAVAIVLVGPGRYGLDGDRGWARRPFIGSIAALVLGHNRYTVFARAIQRKAGRELGHEFVELGRVLLRPGRQRLHARQLTGRGVGGRLVQRDEREQISDLVRLELLLQVFGHHRELGLLDRVDLLALDLGLGGLGLDRQAVGVFLGEDAGDDVAVLEVDRRLHAHVRHTHQPSRV